MSAGQVMAGMGPIMLDAYRRCYCDRARFAQAEAQRRARPALAPDVEPEPQAGLNRILALPVIRTSGPPEPAVDALERSLGLALDSVPDVVSRVLDERSLLLLDVPDPVALEHVRQIWPRLLGTERGEILFLTKSTANELRSDYQVAALILTEPTKPRDRGDLDKVVTITLAWAVPMVAISPAATSHMPKMVLDAARHRLLLGQPDAAIVAATIRLVTGGRCRTADLDGLGPFTLGDLAVALRHDRTPAACVAELRRLGETRLATRGARELTLDQLHGLDPAVSWARSLIADLAAWRLGQITWDQIDHGIVLDGPPGTGKTLFAQILANATGLPLIAGSLARWQSNGHLGDLLKAMRADFDAARAQTPAIMFIDEVDAFADRSSVKHDHKDYVIEVVNGFIEQLDGIGGREGLIFVAASNDVRRCDPAIVRAGRLNRIVRIDLPDQNARARMLRVRLGSDLRDADLDRIARLTDRMSGADIELLVKDARRAARQAGRPITEADLVTATETEDRELSSEMIRRAAVHEGGHALLAVLLNGPAGITVTVQSRSGMAGWVTHRRSPSAGTRTELEARIAVLLAGRAAEAIVLGGASAGAGGSAGSDLEIATRLAAGMVGSFGLAGPAPLLFTGSMDDTADILALPSLRHAAHELLTAMDARVRVLLKGHRRALDRIVERLMADRHLDGDAVAALIRGTAPTASSEPSPLDQVRIRISMAQAPFIGPRPGAHS